MADVTPAERTVAKARAASDRGRLGVVSLQLTQPPSPMTRPYLAARRHLPDVLGCRPIPLLALLTDAGWQLQARQPLSPAGLPVTAAVAAPACQPTRPGS
jgi:hypothetical protein